LNKAIQQWVAALTQEKGFEAWKNAKWASLPVGPGTHNWLVIIRKDQIEVGYMIVGALEDGKHYKLIEYGLGTQPLYGFEPLYRSLVQQELIDSSITYASFVKNLPKNIERLYLGPLAAFWKMTIGVDIYYFDAKTGELLPDLSNALLPKISPTPAPASSSSDELIESNEFVHSTVHVKQTVVRASFDPWDNPSWITEKPLSVASQTDLKDTLIQSNPLTYVAKMYQNQAIFSFAVIGYQQWSTGQLYATLDQEGARYVPLSSLMRVGAFYS